MEKPVKSRGCIFALSISLFVFTACSGRTNALSDRQVSEPPVVESSQTEEEIPQMTETSQEEVQNKPAAPCITDVDWQNYFEGLDGAAVVFDPAKNCYQIYNQELALTRRSPCSTFKIISSLIALENGIIVPEDSIRTWSGEIFWNEEWNQDIDFDKAFHTSCVWYFREVIDEIGSDLMQEELNRLQYGNCDISDWEGRLNTNNNNRTLTGFWLESSLKISPKEQAEVMERIFGNGSAYSRQTQNQLKQVMLISGENDTDILIYGKTGMGKTHGIVVDSWFTGFADMDGRRIYFCIYLGAAEGANASSAKAKEIAIGIISDFYK